MQICRLGYHLRVDVDELERCDTMENRLDIEDLKLPIGNNFKNLGIDPYGVPPAASA